MTKAFHALDITTGGDISALTAGTGALTEARTSTIYLPDENGVWQSFSSGVPGKVYANGQWWLYGGPAATNLGWYSDDLAQASKWTASSATAVKDAIGLTGSANSATTMTDNSAIASGYIQQSVAVASGTYDYTLRVFIKKDSDESRFPEIALRLNGDGVARYVHVNTATGDSAVRYTSGTTSHEINDAGDWWEVLIQGNHLTTTNYIHLRPACGDVIGVLNAATTGSCVIGNAELYKDKTIAQVRGSSPIFTAGATGTVNATDLSFDDANHDDTEGAYYCEFKNVGAVATTGLSFIAVGTTGLPLYAYNGLVKSYEGTNAANAPVSVWTADDTEYKAAVAYGSSALRVNLDDIWGTAASYDGVFNNSLSKMSVLRSNVPTSAIKTVMLLRNLRRYDLSYAEAVDAIPDMMNGTFPAEGRSPTFSMEITRRNFGKQRTRKGFR